MNASILVAGIGNIFLGDDGFGCEVVRALRATHVPESVKLVDYGIRGLDLAYELLEPYMLVIFIDAIARGDAVGTVNVLEPAGEITIEDGFDAHSMDPVSLMAMAHSFGEITARLLIVGCEPQDFGDELQGRIGLSPKVSSAVSEAVRVVLDLIAHVSLDAMTFAMSKELGHVHRQQGGIV